MTASRLLDLPKEIRLLILEHLFDNDKPIIIGRPSSMPWHGKASSYYPPIMKVCRLLRKEALPLFYKGRRVILVLRFREGRAQVDKWIKTELSVPAICRNIKEVSIQIFELPHRTTAMSLDCKSLSILNRESFVHPLTGQSLRILRESDIILAGLRERGVEMHMLLQEAVSQLVSKITAGIEESRVMQRECMANLQLQGYTDFHLRFEVISMLYHGCGD